MEINQRAVTNLVFKVTRVKSSRRKCDRHAVNEGGTEHTGTLKRFYAIEVGGWFKAPHHFKILLASCGFGTKPGENFWYYTTMPTDIGDARL